MSTFCLPSYCGSRITVGGNVLLPFASVTQFRGISIVQPVRTLFTVAKKLGGARTTSSFSQMNTRCSAATSASFTASAPEDVQQTIDRILAKQTKTVLYLTGGASSALSWLLSTPGSSNTVLDARVPYAAASLTELLGAEPVQFASTDVAVAMAKAAYKEAASLSTSGFPIAGLGCTCALRTNREKKGDHKVFVAAHTGLNTHVYSLQLHKGARTRAQEDELASRIMLTALAAVNKVPCDLLKGHLATGDDGDTAEQLQVASTSLLEDPIHLLLNGAIECAEFSGGQVYVDAPRRRRLYLPGSFNPLHEGHQQMLHAARLVHGGFEGIYEFSIGNADKGLLGEEEITRRVQQFIDKGLPVVVTQAPLFTQKAELFPGSCFVVGYDTAVRLVRPEYYGNDTAMLLQFAKMVYRGCKFLVAGRLEDNTFKTLAEVEMPLSLQREGLFEGIPEDVFRKDISSTELREKGMGLVSA